MKSNEGCSFEIIRIAGTVTDESIPLLSDLNEPKSNKIKSIFVTSYK